MECILSPSLLLPFLSSHNSSFIFSALFLFTLFSLLSNSSGFISGAGLIQIPNSGPVVGGIWVAMGFLWLIPIPAAAFLVFIVSP